MVNGGKGLALGYESREISFGDREYLLAPLDAAGKTIDFTFKDAKFGDMAAIREALYSPQDQLARPDVTAQQREQIQSRLEQLAVGERCCAVRLSDAKPVDREPTTE